MEDASKGLQAVTARSVKNAIAGHYRSSGICLGRGPRLAKTIAIRNRPGCDAARDPDAGAAGGGAMSREDLMARLAKAKEYKAAVAADKDKKGQQGEFISQLDEVPDVDGSHGVKGSTRYLSEEEFQASFNAHVDTGSSGTRHRKTGFRSRKSNLEQASDDKDSAEEAKTGSDDGQAARFLGSVLDVKEFKDSAGLDKDMRAEDFTLAKEQRIREKGAEIISVEQGYSPKVSTWGVFPRPANISKTYGGGRTLAPGEALESEERRKERDEEVLASLQSYRKRIKLEIEPEVEAECQGLVDEGLKLLRTGRLKEAYDKLDTVAGKAGQRTEVGGEALLNKAICLDSLGRNQDAKILYQQLQTHPVADIKKRAKQLLFGFEAMDNLKTHTMSYGVGQGYKEYFEKIRSDWDLTYVGKESLENTTEDESDFPAALLLSGFIFFLPVLAVLALAYMS
eukprot:evm.model.scf_1229.3 EVM.evm.TU.scf_1229.3   scf_1229:16912-20312(-)